MNSSTYALERIFKLNDYEYKAKNKSINFDSKAEYVEEDLLYRNYMDMLEQKFMQERKKTHMGVEQLIEEIGQEMKSFNISNKVRLTFKISSLLCFVFSFTTLFIYYLAVLEKVNLNPIFIIIWIPVGLGAWLANSINYEIWKSNNGEL